MFNGALAIKFVEEQICWPYGNPVCIFIDADSKFDNAAVRDIATSSYNPRGNTKVKRMAGTLKRAVEMAAASERSQDWDVCLGRILAGYRGRHSTDGNSPIEILVGIKHSFSFEATHYGLIAANSGLIRGLEIALVNL